MRHSNHTKSVSLSRMPKRKGVPLATLAVTGLSIVGGGMFAMALPNLISGEGLPAIIKGVLLGSGALLASLAVNRLAIDRGAPLASIGMPGAGMLSVFAITLVGTGMWGATYSGSVLPDVEVLRLEQHNSAYDHFVDDRAQMAAEASRIVPVIRSIHEDLGSTEACEIATSCLSLREASGSGRVSFAIAAERQRAESILTQVEEGNADRAAIVRSLNELSAQYQDVLADPDLGFAERRKKLQSIDAERGQALSGLDAAMPIGLLEGYIGELQSGRSIPDRPIASRKLNELLAGYGESLRTVLDKLESGAQDRPAFPAKTGVTDTFGYIGHFLPIALITFCVDVAFALILWAITLMSLIWRGYREDPPEVVDDRDGENLSTFLNQKLLDHQDTRRITDTRAHRRSRRHGRK